MFVDIFYKITNLIEGKSFKEFIIRDSVYKEIKLIGEGGYGYVYLVEHKETLKKYALKYMNIPDAETLEVIKKEIKLWKVLSESNSNTVKLIDYDIETTCKASSNKESENKGNNNNNDNTTHIAIAKCLMEYSSEGTLLKYLNSSNDLSEKEILSIIKDIALFLVDIHSLNYSHRDLKPENILKFNNQYKVCDFGSSSNQNIDYKTKTKKEIIKYFDEFEKFTTFYYRPPEMVDRFCEYQVNTKVDIWMLGCIVYVCAFKKHPFENAQKLTIINCGYSFPQETKFVKSNNDTDIVYSEKLKDFIRILLCPNPVNRPSIKQVIEIISSWDKIVDIDLPDECLEVKSRQLGVKIVKKKDSFNYQSSDVTNNNGGNKTDSCDKNEENNYKGDSLNINNDDFEFSSNINDDNEYNYDKNELSNEDIENIKKDISYNEDDNMIS